MSRRAKIQERVAIIGASATLIAAGFTGAVQLIDDPGSGASAVSCSAAVARVATTLEEHPELENLYAHDAEYLPALFSEDEVAECGDPQYLVEGIGEADAREAGGEESGSSPHDSGLRSEGNEGGAGG